MTLKIKNLKSQVNYYRNKEKNEKKINCQLNDQFEKTEEEQKKKNQLIIDMIKEIGVYNDEINGQEQLTVESAAYANDLRLNSGISYNKMQAAIATVGRSTPRYSYSA